MRSTRRRIISAVAVAGLALSGTAAPALAEDPPFVPWSGLLSSFTTGYDPSSANDCTAGNLRCVDAVIREMDQRVRPLDRDCDHNVMFGLMYLRTTEEYRRSATTPGFFTDPAFINHQDAVFARYYFDAWDGYRSGDVAGTSRAWQIAFEAADAERVAGLGNMFLGMSAHVNRDLPLVLAEIGLVKPDGTSRKPDHDKVNQFLNTVIQPLFDEASARFDPTVDDGQIDGTTMDEAASLQVLVGWREQAWRNAERIVNAPTPVARDAVLADIERIAAIEANLLVVATSYSSVNVQAALAELHTLGAAPADTAQAQLDRTANQARGLLGTAFTSGRTIRNEYCASHG